MSKKQTGVETSSFGSEFIAMKQCTEYLRGLRYKLRMMGIPCDLPSYVFGDNQSVLANTAIPDSTLKKKSQSIAYHFVREGCARDEWRMTYVNTHEIPSDLLTKPLPSGEKRMSFVRMILHHIFGSGLDRPSWTSPLGFQVFPICIDRPGYFSWSFYWQARLSFLEFLTSVYVYTSDEFSWIVYQFGIVTSQPTSQG